MEQEKMQAVALMRYSAIAPLITGLQYDYPSRDAFFRDASVKGVTTPDGSIRHYAPATIEKWYYRYKETGFDGLIPSGRSDLGKPRKLENDFLLEIERRVSADCMIVIDHVEYKVDCRFAKQRICLRYSPDMKDIFIVEADGFLTPIRLLSKQENAFVK